MGPAGVPVTYRSSDYSSRVFGASCGSSIGAIDDAPTIALLVGSFDDPGQAAYAPAYHAFEDGVPGWWARGATVAD